MGNAKTKGYLLAIISAVTYGAIPLFAIPIKQTGFSFDSALFYRFMIGAAVVGVYLAAGKVSFRVSLKEAGALFLLGLSYALSAHFLWLGERTRSPDSPQAEFLRGVINPVGVKCGPDSDAPGLERLLDRLNPLNEPGKITLILRAGVDKAEKTYRALLRDFRSSGRHILWVVDPMHGNPRNDGKGVKTRMFSDIMRECEIFIDVCRQEGAHPGGVHLEMTGQDVTECLGGSDRVEDLSCNYDTLCDPRLNASQSLELAFAFAERMVNSAPPQERRTSGRF